MNVAPVFFVEMSKSNFYRQKSYLTIFGDHLGTTFWDHVFSGLTFGLIIKHCQGHNESKG